MSTADIAAQFPLGARVRVWTFDGDIVTGTVAHVDGAHWAKRSASIETKCGIAVAELARVSAVTRPQAPSPPPDAPFAAWLSQHPGVETELVRAPSSSSRDAAFEREKADMLGRRD